MAKIEIQDPDVGICCSVPKFTCGLAAEITFRQEQNLWLRSLRRKVAASSGAGSRYFWLLRLSAATSFAALTDSRHLARQRTKKRSVASTVVWHILKSGFSTMPGEDSRARRSLYLVSLRLGPISV